MQRIFGEDHEVHAGQVGARLGDGPHDLRGLGRELVRRRDHGQLQLHETDHHPVGALVEAA